MPDLPEVNAMQRPGEAQLSLEERAELYRMIVEQPLAGVYIMEAGRFAYVNPHMASIFGYTADELCDGRPVTSVVAEHERARVQSLVQRRLSGELDLAHYDFDGLRSDGTILRIEAFGRREVRNGRVLVVGMLRDVTAERRAESELRLLLRAVEQSPTSVLITDRDGTIAYVNPHFEQVSGYSRAEVIGRNPRMLRSGLHDEAFYQRMWDTLTAGQPWSGELHNRSRDGRLYTELVTISPIHDDDGVIRHYVGVKLEVTQQRFLEQQLRQAQRMEAIGRLAGGIAHDFNNLLTVISGHTQFLLDQLADGNGLRADAEQVAGAAERAARLTRQLLAFSRKQVLQPRTVRLGDILRDMEPMLRRLIGGHIEFLVDLPADEGTVSADPGQVEQVLMNLIVNARDAMPDGGAIHVTVRNVSFHDDTDAGDGGTVPAGDYVQLAVSDNGTGMPPEVVERIFEPFFTTKEIGKGTGLGLSTTYGIVRQSAGHITVESVPGGGTTFRIALPQVALPD